MLKCQLVASEQGVSNPRPHQLFTLQLRKHRPADDSLVLTKPTVSEYDFSHQFDCKANSYICFIEWFASLCRSLSIETTRV